MLTGAPFFEQEFKDGTRHNRVEDLEDEDGSEKQVQPVDLTASMITRVLKSVQ